MSVFEIGPIVAEHCDKSHGHLSLNQAEELMLETSAILRKVAIDDEPMPYGRYLLWKHPKGLANIQVDVFSLSYEGLVHAHGSWGLLHVLKGQLIVEDWEERSNEYLKSRSSLLSPGSGQCFCPPISDWHKVRTGNETQVVSIHVYGLGFNLEIGTYLDENYQAKQSKRGPLKAFEDIQSHFF